MQFGQKTHLWPCDLVRCLCGGRWCNRRFVYRPRGKLYRQIHPCKQLFRLALSRNSLKVYNGRRFCLLRIPKCGTVFIMSQMCSPCRRIAWPNVHRLQARAALHSQMCHDCRRQPHCNQIHIGPPRLEIQRFNCLTILGLPTKMLVLTSRTFLFQMCVCVHLPSP